MASAFLDHMNMIIEGLAHSVFNGCSMSQCIHGEELLSAVHSCRCHR